VERYDQEFLSVSHPLLSIFSGGAHVSLNTVRLLHSSTCVIFAFDRHAQTSWQRVRRTELGRRAILACDYLPRLNFLLLFADGNFEIREL
jgi:hypothetical protein